MRTLHFGSRSSVGINSYGSSIWADVSEHVSNGFEIADTYQVFGHTQMSQERITPYWACLDCARPFMLDENFEEFSGRKDMLALANLGMDESTFLKKDFSSLLWDMMHDENSYPITRFALLLEEDSWQTLYAKTRTFLFLNYVSRKTI